MSSVFADWSRAEMACDYHLAIAQVLKLGDRLVIAYQHPQTRIVEDVKAILSAIEATSDSES
ncbi:MAG: hypothetical protein P5683_17685 [Limnospira sp. PMC 1279.21]|nr:MULTISPECIES: hypothetical protein [Limnospira]EKD08101.1 hypothetical protein SPLC1_S270230 [Arthrospira platensis C1]MDT9230570.1 hypothetical protein [Limnospira sp. PMC 1242.20]MDT9271265.1 hypothetical protein [Limnospira sp. PMC 1234.20]MDY7055245.1 hypothetical protein [Limnospira fusiformis LS22]MDT9187242.1 hypothetical protein [Limnospira sp. PMC 894.15]